MNPIKTISIPIRTEGTPISSDSFKELADKLKDGKSVLMIKDGKFDVIEKKEDHGIQKLFKKISYFFYMKEEAKNEVEQMGDKLIKNGNKELGKLFIKIGEDQRKSGLGGSSYINNHRDAIFKELKKNEDRIAEDSRNNWPKKFADMHGSKEVQEFFSDTDKAVATILETWNVGGNKGLIEDNQPEIKDACQTIKNLIANSSVDYKWGEDASSDRNLTDFIRCCNRAYTDFMKTKDPSLEFIRNTFRIVNEIVQNLESPP